MTHHACATGLLAVDVAGRLLAGDADAGALALVLTGEKAFTRDAQYVPGTSIFGEGAAACLVSLHGARDRVIAYASSIRGEFDGRLDAAPEMASRFEKEYPVSLAEAISAAVAQAGVSLDDISLILPHNVNALSWQRLCRRIGFPADRVLLSNVPVTGHAFCADCVNQLHHRGRSRAACARQQVPAGRRRARGDVLGHGCRALAACDVMTAPRQRTSLVRLGHTGMDHQTLTSPASAELRPRVFDSISKLLPRVLGREIPAMSEDMKLMSELGMRSASMLELLLEIEDDLEIQIEVEDIDDAAMTSVGDLADFVASHAITDG